MRDSKAPKVASDTGAGLREGLEALFEQAFADGMDAGKTGDESLLAGSAAVYAQSALNLLATPTDATDGATGGGHADTEGEAMFAHLNCPCCGGSGHIDDCATTPGGDLLEQAAGEPTDEMLDALFPIGDGLIYREVAGAAGFSNWQPDRQEQRKRYAAMLALKAAGDGGEA